MIGLTVFLLFGLPASFCLNIYNGPTSAALLDVIPSEERGAADGTELFLAHLLGDVFSPVLIGLFAVFLTVQLGGDRIGLALLITCPDCADSLRAGRRLGQSLLFGGCRQARLDRRRDERHTRRRRDDMVMGRLRFRRVAFPFALVHRAVGDLQPGVDDRQPLAQLLLGDG